MAANTGARPPAAPLWTTDMTIGGLAVTGLGATVPVHDPATEKTLAEIRLADEAQVHAAVRAAEMAFTEGSWASLAPADRSAALYRLAAGIEARFDELVTSIVYEVGTPVTLARALQVQIPLDLLREYARLAAIDRTEQLGPSFGPPSASLVRYAPVGVVAALVAYNYPLFLGIHKIGAALAAGCTVVAMPSVSAPLTMLLLGEIGRDADLPPGVLNVITGGPEVGRMLTESDRVSMVSFTGSVAVGAEVAKQAARGLKRCVLELGGKSPNVLLPGTDVQAAAEAVHLRYLRNAGQGCASPTRILVDQSQLSSFIDASREVFAGVRTGDPWDAGTVVGPLISAAHRDRVEGYVASALSEGGSIIAGGGRPANNTGWYVNPTLVGGVDLGARISQEEIFGPVGVVLPYKTVDEALTIANHTRFGLSANVFSGDLEEALAFSARLQAGTVTINGGGGLRTDAPFGGVKQSGIGREGGEWGVREFLEPQHIQWAL